MRRVARWRDQRGSALLSTLGVTAAALLGVMLLMDIFSIYVTRRAGRTAADAAALGALQAAQQAFNRLAREALQGRLNELERAVNRDAAEEVSEWELSRREGLEAELAGREPPLPEEEMTAEIARVIARERPEMRRAAREAAIRSRVADRQVEQALVDRQPVPFTAALAEFFSPAELGCLVRRVGAEEEPALRRAALWFAQQNGGRTIRSFAFPYQGQVKVRVEVTAPVALGISARYAPVRRPLLEVEATSRAVDLGGLQVDLQGRC